MIKRLKDTGMPVKEIKDYAELRAAGDPALSERMEMLIKLNEKIEFYSNEIERVNTRGAE